MTRTVVFAFSVSRYCVAGVLHPLLGQERANRLPHLIERRALHARLVRLIPGGDVGVGDRRDLRRDLLLDQRGAVDALRLRLLVDQRRGDDLLDARRGALRRAPATASRCRSCWPAAAAPSRRPRASVIDVDPDRRDDVGRRRLPRLLCASRTSRRSGRTSAARQNIEFLHHRKVYLAGTFPASRCGRSATT